jgi:hypothetical protein
MRQLLYRFWLTAKYGFLDGIAAGLNSNYDPQEQERKKLLRHVENAVWSDSEVCQEFICYCHRYDRQLRLTRTKAVLSAMLAKRPGIRRCIKK